MREQAPIRLVTRTRRQPVERIGRQAHKPLTDLFHYLMDRHWWQLFALLFLAFVLANLCYAAAYSLCPDGISGAHSFLDLYFFSIQTMATIGYGVMAPQTLAAHLVSSTEAFVGLIGFAMGSGLILARFARPTAKILFSQVAAVSIRDGEPAFTLRIANERDNQILEGSVTLSYLATVQTREGEMLRRFRDMKLERMRTPVFALTWTVVHPIDAESPLFQKTMADLEAEQAEILVTFRGIDETFSQEIYARFSYAPEEIRWNERFVDILGFSKTGRRTINIQKFHDTQPWTF